MIHDDSSSTPANGGRVVESAGRETGKIETSTSNPQTTGQPSKTAEILATLAVKFIPAASHVVTAPDDLWRESAKNALAKAVYLYKAAERAEAALEVRA